MDVFDSRALGPFDSYGQRFMRPGSFHYNLVPAGFTGMSLEYRFSVVVTEAEEEHRMEQHNVAVRTEGRELWAEPEDLTVAVGDLVLWHGPGLRTRFAVDGDREFFRSSGLATESGYSHAFGVAGDYRWVDANGSKLSGRVVVTDMDASTDAGRRRWLETLRKGTVVMIQGESAEPAEVKIITGQTVFFAVTKAPGVSITDERLVRIGRPPVSHEPSAPRARKAPGAARKATSKSTRRARTKRS